MSLEKAIKYGKEKRKQYYKFCKLVDPSCRNHGGCPWCEGNRSYSTRKRLASSKDKES